MSRFVFLFLISITLLFANPYSSLAPNKKLEVMINHFVNEQIKQTFPVKPQKDKYVPEKTDFNPGEYERYYNYIQRLKAIEVSNKEQLQKINTKYRGQAAYYNGKLDYIKDYYQKRKNLHPFLQKAINDGFKVVYGKPYITDLTNKKDGVEGILKVQKIYHLKNTLDLKVLFDKSLEDKDVYKKYPVKVTFLYDGEYLTIDQVQLSTDNKTYVGKLKNPNNGKIKLKVKINDDIFQKIKIEDIK